MKTLKFQTNIKCEGCLKSVTPYLNHLDNVSSWKVKIDDPEKTLEVISETGDEQDVIEMVKKAGFEIEKV